jgi:LSD1 subclass zinc finger protein
VADKVAGLYRVREKPAGDNFETTTAEELSSALFAEEAAAAPEYPYLPEGEWYCPNEDCEVREVRVSMKYLDGPPPASPPKLRCPACRTPLEFHHYLRGITLVPCAGPV